MVIVNKIHMMKYFVVVFSMLFFFAGCGTKSGPVTLSDGQKGMVVKGRVMKHEVVTGSLLLKTPEGDEVTVTITDTTEEKDFDSKGGKIQGGTSVEVIYLQNDPAKPAVSVRKLPKGGC